MSGLLAKEKEALAKEEGKLKKFLKALKKFLAKEFLWVFCIALLAIPMAYLANYFIETYASEARKELQKFLNGKSMLLALYLMSILGIYFTRTVAGSIALAIQKPKK